jgi:hypothetical protein
VFIQTRKYCSSKVREVQTRDMTNSLAAADDVKLPFPRLIDMRYVPVGTVELRVLHRLEGA